MSSALTVTDLSKTFTSGGTLFGRSQSLQALRGVSFQVNNGETLGVVGESGCGKSTLARLLVGLDKPTAGRVELVGENLSAYHAGSELGALGRVIQYVFQDPLSALNPRKTIRQILEAPLRHLLDLDTAARRRRVHELLDAVELRREFLDRYPHEFSGGQAQRIVIARALAAEPRILVLDEPVSALDVSVQAQVLGLLTELRQALGLTYLFISHDLAVVEAVSDRVAVMYFGDIVELGDASTVFRTPRHPYTALLAASAPRIGHALNTPGADFSSAAIELPDPLQPPPGCAFAPRCARAIDNCRRAEQPPVLTVVAPKHTAACVRPLI